MCTPWSISASSMLVRRGSFIYIYICKYTNILFYNTYLLLIQKQCKSPSTLPFCLHWRFTTGTDITEAEDENSAGVRFVATVCSYKLQDMKEERETMESRFLVYLYPHGDTFSLFFWVTPAHWTWHETLTEVLVLALKFMGAQSRACRSY